MREPLLLCQTDPSRGVVLSLVDKRSGRELAGNTDGLGLGQYLYERFDKDRVMQWCKDYVRARPTLGRLLQARPAAVRPVSLPGLVAEGLQAPL